MEPTTPSPAVACSLTDAALRERRALVRERLLPHLAASERLAHGLRLRFPDTPALRAEVTRFVELERQCCGFLTFTLAPPGAGLVLTIEGPPEAAETLELFAAALG